MTTAALFQPTEKPRMSTLHQAALSLYWFGVSAHWTIILITTLPAQAELIGGEAVRGQTVGTVLAIGAFLSMVVAPVFGALSDRIVTPFGRRRPWIVLGTLMNLIGLYGLAYFPRANDLSSLPLYIGAFLWVQFWNNVATAPYAALIPDVVPADQRGSASGWYGLMTIFGTLVAAIAPFLFTSAGTTDITALYYFTGAVLLFGMLGTVLFVHEPPARRAPPPFSLSGFLKGLIEPLKDNDFRWVFMTRLLMVMGVYSIQPFLQFYMGSVVKDFNLFNAVNFENAITATSIFLLLFLVGALPSSIAGGILSDRYGRKLMVYISSVFQAIVPVIFVLFAPNFTITALLGLVFGIGYGAYQSVDWAMASEVLPSEEDYAKDMGVWHIAMTLPQVLATLIAGFLLDYFNNASAATPGVPGTFGFTVIFAFATLYFILGTVLVRRIRKVR
jgi:MFS family permease